MITPALLKNIAPVYRKGSQKDSLMGSLSAALNKYLSTYDITSRIRVCHFLAQGAQETNQFNTLEEYGGPDYWSQYEGREGLGNTQKGDGIKFHGRGFLQTTGRYNYTVLESITGLDVVNNPDLLLNPDLAVLSACIYWKTKKINSLADIDDVTRVTKAVNGGKTGLKERGEFLIVAKRFIGEDLNPSTPTFPLPGRKPVPPIQGVPPEAPIIPTPRPTPIPSKPAVPPAKTAPAVLSPRNPGIYVLGVVAVAVVIGLIIWLT